MWSNTLKVIKSSWAFTDAAIAIEQLITIKPVLITRQNELFWIENVSEKSQIIIKCLLFDFIMISLDIFSAEHLFIATFFSPIAIFWWVLYYFHFN